MDSAARLQRLEDLIVQAKVLSSQSPVPCVLLRVLVTLSGDEIAELGTRHLNKDVHGRILIRLGQSLGIDAGLVFRILTRSLACDLEDYAPKYAAARRVFEEASVAETEIQKWLAHQPPESVAFIHGFRQFRWSGADETRSTGLGLGEHVDEDGRRSLICAGYLVAAGLAFPTTVALLRTSMEQRWGEWQALWQYF